MLEVWPCVTRAVASMSTLNPRVVLSVASLLVATSAWAAGPCLSDKSDSETVVGRLSVGKARDANGRPERPYILTLAADACLKATDDDNVDKTRTIHIFSTQDGIRGQISKFVGKSIEVRGRPMVAHTAHHHAPIIMDISAIAAR